MSIYTIKSPNLPQFRFEWHPQVKRVYVIRIGGTTEIGEPIADGIENQGSAINAALIWQRGFREGSGTTLTGEGKLIRKENAV